MSYYNKYLKYKNKYLNFLQKGGNVVYTIEMVSYDWYLGQTSRPEIICGSYNVKETVNQIFKDLSNIYYLFVKLKVSGDDKNKYSNSISIPFLFKKISIGNKSIFELVNSDMELILRQMHMINNSKQASITDKQMNLNIIYRTYDIKLEYLEFLINLLNDNITNNNPEIIFRIEPYLLPIKELSTGNYYRDHIRFYMHVDKDSRNNFTSYIIRRDVLAEDEISSFFHIPDITI